MPNATFLYPLKTSETTSPNVGKYRPKQLRRRMFLRSEQYVDLLFLENDWK